MFELFDDSEDVVAAFFEQAEERDDAHAREDADDPQDPCSLLLDVIGSSGK